MGCGASTPAADKDLASVLPSPDHGNTAAIAVPTENELKVIFKRIDASGDGTITRAELKKFLAADTEDTLQRLLEKAGGSRDYVMQQLDLDGNGKIDFDEFEELLSFRHVEATAKRLAEFKEPLGVDHGVVADIEVPTKQKIKELFKKIDANGDGVLTKIELKRFLLADRQDTLQRLLSKACILLPGLLTLTVHALRRTPLPLCLLFALTAVAALHVCVAQAGGSRDYVLQQLDIDGDGRISHKEFEELLSFRHAAKHEKRLAEFKTKEPERSDRLSDKGLRSLFDELDADRDGQLTKSDVTKKCATDTQLQRLMVAAGGSADYVWEQLDVNGSGKVDRDEFFAMLSADPTAFVDSLSQSGGAIAGGEPHYYKHPKVAKPKGDLDAVMMAREGAWLRAARAEAGEEAELDQELEALLEMTRSGTKTKNKHDSPAVQFAAPTAGRPPPTAPRRDMFSVSMR